MTDPQTSQIYHQEHRALSPTIDEAYIETVIAAAELKEYLCTRMGPIREPFLAFYRRFNILYMMTCQHKEMDPYRDTAKQITAWAYPGNHITPAKCMKGIDLFDLWQAHLFKAGIMSVRK